MEEVCFVLSVCCPHFENKRKLFCALADRLGTRGVKTSVVLAGNAACSHIIRLNPSLTGNRMSRRAGVENKGVTVRDSQKA